MRTNGAQRSNDSFPGGFVPGVSLMTASRAERVVSIDPTGWVASNCGNVLHQNEPFVPHAEGQQLVVIPADMDECNEYHSSISYPAEFEVEVCDIHIGGGDVLRPKKPLVLRASLCDPDGCYRADVPGIETPIAAFGRNEMIDAFTDLLAHLWKEYALEEDVNLKPRAQQLKACLLRDYSVVS